MARKKDILCAHCLADPLFRYLIVGTFFFLFSGFLETSGFHSFYLVEKWKKYAHFAYLFTKSFKKKII